MANNNKKPSNYFTQNIKQNGENFLQQKNPLQLKQDALRIFRDLARGKIDPEKEGQMFLEPTLLDSSILMAEEKYRNEQISRDGVYCLIVTNNNMVDDSVFARLDEHAKAVEGYKCILEGLYNLKNTQDINYLYATVNVLRNFRNYI